MGGVILLRESPEQYWSLNSNEVLVVNNLRCRTGPGRVLSLTKTKVMTYIYELLVPSNGNQRAMGQRC